ncbi:MAG: low molecular weight protein-tyrosine phosphatase [Nocardioidaceae bacterium]|nr:low molecular weight protein-tyrosine phosphatase [Nocardioidaceae bacterium]
MRRLPPPRRPGHYAIALVCLGNICRSPMAHVVLEARLADRGLADRVVVHSSGTGDWHVGQPMDERAAQTLSRSGYDPSRHRAVQYDHTWLEDHDVVLAMDESNLDDLGGPSERVGLFRDLDPAGAGEVPDPYYGGADGFDQVLEMIERTSEALADAVADHLT